jgi:hypothetical protein
LLQIKPIISADDLTPTWLSSLLGRPVTDVISKAIGTGQVGATFRFKLVSDDSRLLQSLVGKFMSDDPVSRATGIAQLSYVREVNFYRHYGDAARLPIPNVSYIHQDDTSHAFALVMEDFPNHVCGNQLSSASLGEAQLAMRAAAQIHSAYWDDASLDTHTWLNGSHATESMNVDGLYAMLWPAFCARYADRLSDDISRVGESYLGNINAWIARRVGPRCLTHGDFRPDNMLLNPQDAAKPIVIVDWQTAGVGSGATDIAYYLGTALSPDVRRTHEQDLVELWITTLQETGVPTSQTQDLWHAYQNDAISGFLMGVLASMIVAQTPRGDDMFLQMCDRSATMVVDWGVLPN